MMSLTSGEIQDLRVVIIGSGPTGLGAAYRLAQLGLRNFTILEQNDHPGGLASSFTDGAGFTWDVGGHVQFSHYPYFDHVMDRVLGDEWIYHQRESWIWVCDRFIPYPFQNNIHYLPEEQSRICLRALLNLKPNGHIPAHFEDWIRSSFGNGIADLFLIPYNFKVWAYPPRDLSYTWIGERVASVDLERVVFNYLDKRQDAGWGPNNTFRFPLTGGTGQIWRRVAGTLPANSVQYRTRVCAINTRQNSIVLSDGRTEKYDILISTMPLDVLCRLTELTEMRDVSERLRFSTVHVVGIGLSGQPGPHLKTKCWMYFPESNCPFYRVTVFSNYSPNNVPDPSSQWSLMAEVSESPVKPVDRDEVVESVIKGLLATKLIQSRTEVVSTWQFVADHGYPTPFLGRDTVVKPSIDFLEQHNIYSRGRFGAWKYEVSNQDHSFMQGVELVNRLAFGVPEMTYNHPAIANSRAS